MQEENANEDVATFLDLNITITKGSFQLSYAIKRMDFFPIVRLPYKCGNILSKMFCSTISTDVLRICRATSFNKDLLSGVHELKSWTKKIRS